MVGICISWEPLPLSLRRLLLEHSSSSCLTMLVLFPALAVVFRTQLYLQLSCLSDNLFFLSLIAAHQCICKGPSAGTFYCWYFASNRSERDQLEFDTRIALLQFLLFERRHQLALDLKQLVALVYSGCSIKLTTRKGLQSRILPRFCFLSQSTWKEYRSCSCISFTRTSWWSYLGFITFSVFWLVFFSMLLWD